MEYEKEQAELRQSAEELREFVEKIVVHAPDESSALTYTIISSRRLIFPRNLVGIAKRQPHDTFASCGCSPIKKTSLSGTPMQLRGMFEGLLLFDQVLAHIQGAGEEDDAALDEVLEVLVDVGHSQADED